MQGAEEKTEASGLKLLNTVRGPVGRIFISTPGLKEGPSVIVLPVGMKETVNGKPAYYLNSAFYKQCQG